MIGIYELAILLILIYLIIWIIAFIDVMKNQFQGVEKLIWFLALLFVPLAGLICYWFFGRKQKIAMIKNPKSRANP